MAMSSSLLPDPSQPLNLRPIPSTPSQNPLIHPRPNPSALSAKGWRFTYLPSPDGHESNLMIMFHGLGDTEMSFAKLGEGLRLPGCCVMSLRGPFGIPMMDTPSFSWFPLDFSASYAPTSQPNPTTLLPRLVNLVRYLVDEVGWELERIHLFGWGEGGSAVLELARDVGVHGLGGARVGKGGRRFGSAVSVCGTLLSTPSITSLPLEISTPVLYFHRPPLRTTPPPTSLRKTFKELTHLTGAHDRGSRTESLRGGHEEDERMLSNKQEWEEVMRFWGGVLVPKDEGGWMKGLRGKGGLGEMYEVVR